MTRWRTTHTGASGAPVVFIGAGPGDLGLLTVRARRALEEAQVVVFDAILPVALLEASSNAAERIRVGDGGVPRAAVPSLLVARATAGLRVARLLAGDGGEFGHEARTVAAAGVAFEVVPGVSPAVAGLTYAGIPCGGPDPVVVLAETASGPTASDTVAMRVSRASLAATVAALMTAGRPGGSRAALISGEGTLQQRTLTATLGGLPAAAAREGCSFPALLVVGAAVAHRAGLAWLERRPLHGRRVLVTRPRAQAARFGALLEAYGAEVVALQTIRLEPPDDWRPLDTALSRLAAYRWVIFTSANGVAAFRERLGHARLDARALAGAQLAAIGPETADSLRNAGLEPDVVPSEYRAEGLVDRKSVV